MWKNSIKLPLAVRVETDDDGFETVPETAYIEHVPASFKDLTRSDSEMAAQLGFDASLNVDILACNYDGQRYLIDEETGTKYYVQRTFRKDKSNVITLTVGRRERGGNI